MNKKGIKILMEENVTLTPYDEMLQTRDVQILKSIIPFVDFNAQRQIAMLIQCMEFRQIKTIFSKKENTLSICSIPDGTDKRSALLAAVRKYCSPREQETIDTIITLCYRKEGLSVISFYPCYQIKFTI